MIWGIGKLKPHQVITRTKLFGRWGGTLNEAHEKPLSLKKARWISQRFKLNSQIFVPGFFRQSTRTRSAGKTPWPWKLEHHQVTPGPVATFLAVACTNRMVWSFQVSSRQHLSWTCQTRSSGQILTYELNHRTPCQPIDQPAGRKKYDWQLVRCV